MSLGNTLQGKAPTFRSDEGFTPPPNTARKDPGSFVKRPGVATMRPAVQNRSSEPIVLDPDSEDEEIVQQSDEDIRIELPEEFQLHPLHPDYEKLAGVGTRLQEDEDIAYRQAEPGTDIPYAPDWPDEDIEHVDDEEDIDSDIANLEEDGTNRMGAGLLYPYNEASDPVSDDPTLSQNDYDDENALQYFQDSVDLALPDVSASFRGQALEEYSVENEEAEVEDAEETYGTEHTIQSMPVAKSDEMEEINIVKPMPVAGDEETAKVRVIFVFSPTNFTERSQFSLCLFRTHTFRQFIATVETQIGYHIAYQRSFFLFASASDIRDGAPTPWRVIRDVKDVVEMVYYESVGTEIYMCDMITVSSPPLLLTGCSITDNCSL